MVSNRIGLRLEIFRLNFWIFSSEIVSEAEKIKEYREAFDLFDSNKDGIVTLKGKNGCLIKSFKNDF